MPSRRPRRRREETLGRMIRVQSVESSVFLSRGKPRGLPHRLNCGSTLMLRGTGDEPVRDVQAFTVSLHVQDTEDPQWTDPLTIGAIIQVRPSVRAVVWVPMRAFDHVWALAVSGRLRYCHLGFTAPKRGAAVVVSATFSNGSEDEEPPDAGGQPGRPTSSVEASGVPTDDPKPMRTS